MSISSATIIGTEPVLNTVAYIIEVCLSGGDSWRVYRRYSWFLALAAALPPASSPLPSRWSVWKYSVPERREKLQEFLLYVISLPPSELVGFFLRLPSVVSPDYCFPETASTPCLEDTASILALVASNLEDPDLKSIPWTESLFRALLETVLIPAMSEGPTRRGSAAVLLAARLASVSHNLDAALFIHVARGLNWAPAQLHLQVPLATGNRGAVLWLAETIGIDESLASRKRISCPLWGNSIAFPPAEIPLGPQSPLARSVLHQTSPSTAAQEAREYVEFSIAAGRNKFAQFESAPMTLVSVPAETRALLSDDVHVELSYRAASFEDIEVRLEIRQSRPLNAMVEFIWNLTTAVSSFREEGVLTETGHVVFPDPRRPNGVATMGFIKSIAMGDRSVIVAGSAQTDPLLIGEKVIHHLHFVGAEITEEGATFVGLISSEAIFLIAGDLLGERLALWRLIEQMVQVPAACEKGTTISEWLANES